MKPKVLLLVPLLCSLGSMLSDAYADVNGVFVDPCHPSPGVAKSIKVIQGVVTVSFSGTPTLTYRIDASSDLRTWTAVGSETANHDGVFTYQDTTSASSVRFFRGVAQTSATCPTAHALPTVPNDGLSDAMSAQMSALWSGEIAKLQALTTESQFVAAIPGLKLSPTETAIGALLGTSAPEPSLRELMLSKNRVAMSTGASKHFLALLATLGTSTNTNAVANAMQGVIKASTDPDGIQRMFLLRLWSAIPSQKVRTKSFVLTALTNDTPGSDKTLTADGKRLYRSALFRIYMLTDPDLATELAPNARQWIGALSNKDDKASMMRLLTIRHPGLLVSYMSNRSITAVVQPVQQSGGTP